MVKYGASSYKTNYIDIFQKFLILKGIPIAVISKKIGALN